MAEINFNTMFDQLTDLEKQQYEGVMGMGGFKSLYEQNPDSPLVTQNPNYEKFKEIADTQAQIPEESIMGMLNPFSSASASEVTPSYDLQINNAPSIFDINQVGDPTLNPNSVNVFGLDPYGDINLNMTDLGNPTNDPRVVSEEQSLSGGFVPTNPNMRDIVGDINLNMTDLGNPFNDSRVVSEEQGLSGFPGLGQVDPGFQNALDAREARKNQIEMQQNPDYGQFFDAAPLDDSTQGINYNNLGILGTIGGLLTGSTPLKMLGMFGNYKSGKTGRVFDSFSKGIASLAGRMRGINPITGKPNTQAQYEANREARRTQNRIDYMLDRKAKKKSYSEKNLKDLIGQQIADREDKSGSGKKSGFTNPGTNSYGPHKGSGNDATREGGNCCFIMLESRYGDGTMDKVVRKYRDEKMTPRNRRGYYKMARVLVPLMRKSKLFKWIVAKTFADPLVSYGKWYYGENKHGWIFAPVKTAWLKIFDVVGTDTVFIRENGEEV